MSTDPVKEKLPPKTCVGCGNSYEQRDNEATTRFRKRKFCSVECRGRSQQTDRNMERECEGCGKKFKRRDDELGWRFKRRRSCGEECAHLLRKGKRYGDPTYKTQSDRRKSKPKTIHAPIRIVERTPQLTEPVHWVTIPEPEVRYVPKDTPPQAQNLTQAERTARRARFGQFRTAS
jgi:hypothetical protein